jgi:predicted ATPase
MEEGLAVITKALTIAENTGERYGLAELHRIKGELFLNRSEISQAGMPANDSPRSMALSQARACLVAALAVAREQGTKSWELRAALSMHRLDLILGNPKRTQLTEIYSSFTEGGETADLTQARTLLGLVASA